MTEWTVELLFNDDLVISNCSGIMEVFNRLKNTVSGVMMGNPVTREFDVGIHRASAGSGLLWKIYDGVKKTTKQVW